MGIITGHNLQPVGMAATAKGCLDLLSGRVVEGAAMLFTGLTVMAADAKLNFVHRVDLSNLVKFSLFSGLAAAGVQGGFRFVEGIKQHNSIEILKGAFQAAVGATLGGFASTLSSRVVMIAHQAAIIALPCALAARLGYLDIIKGSYADGLYKLLIGAVGFAGAAYHTQNLMREKFITDDVLIFLEEHGQEIEDMHTKHAVGDWKTIAWGISKIVYEHPKFPGKVIKLVRNPGRLCNKDLKAHHLNLESMREIAETPEFDRIYLPQSHMYQPVRGRLILIEEKILPLKFSTVPDSDEKSTITKQLDNFIDRFGLGDLHPKKDHNAGIINHGGILKMAIYDADSSLQLSQDGNWEWITKYKKNTLVMYLISTTQTVYFAILLGEISDNLDKIWSKRFSVHYIAIPAVIAIIYATNKIWTWLEDPYNPPENNDLILSIGAAMFLANVAIASLVMMANKVSRLFQP